MVNLREVTRTNGEFRCHFNDKKFYKTVNLPNGLKAVLISTNSKEDDKASIALSIKVGSFDDETGYEGLAHLISNVLIREHKFLEHIEQVIEEKEEDESIKDKEEDDSIEENIISSSTTRGIKRKKTDLNQTKKIMKHTKKLLKQKTTERSTYGLIYLLNQVKGSIKLSTESEQTTFQIDLPTDSLKPILDDFFLRFKDQPEFSDYKIKETIKVLRHDYFQNIKSNSIMKLKMFLCYLAKDKELKNYPSNPFIDIDNDEIISQLKEKLIEFFFKYYQSPDKIKLILKSNLKIPEMENLLEQSFANLIKKNDQINLENKTESNGINSLFTDKENQFIFHIKPHNKKPEIEDFLPIRQNLMADLDKFEDYNLSQQFEDKLVEENGLDKTISNKITFDNNHLISSYTSHRQIQIEDDKLPNQLCCIFHVPNDETYYPIMPMHFISSLIRKDGPGTLISYLRECDLVSKIQADNLSDCNFSNNRLWNLFYIKFYLTKKGINRTNEIISCLGSFFHMLHKFNNSNLEKCFKEYTKLMLFDYHFKEIRSNSSHDIFTTVKKMHSYKLSDIFVANRIPTTLRLDQNVRIVKNLLNFLKLENGIFCVLSDEDNFNSIKSDLNTHKGIDIKKEPIYENLFEINDLFKIENYPTKNPFLKDNQQINVERPIFLIPQLVKKTDKAKLLYKKEYSELLPLTSVNLLISIDKFKINAKLAATCDLILAISEIQMEQLFFQIKEAGFLYRVEFNRFGLNISATGNDEINNVFEKILNNFKANLTESKLSKAKKSTRTNYENGMKNKFHVYLELQNSILFKNQYTIQQRLDELDQIKLNDLYYLMDFLFNRSNRIYFIQGNYTVEDTKRFFKQIESLFKYEVDDGNFLSNYDNLIRDNESIKKAIGLNLINNQEIEKIKNQQNTNQTYNINNNEDEDSDERISEELFDQTKNNQQQEEQQKNKLDLTSDELSIICRNLNELIPMRPYHEHYCFGYLKTDSPEPVFSVEKSEIINNNLENEFSIIYTPNIRLETFDLGKRRYIESTSIKNQQNRKLFDTSTVKNPPINASSRMSNSSTISKTKSSCSFVNNICIDTTNHNYNLSPLHKTNDNFSNIINKDSQIISNLFFTYYKNDTKHTILLKLLIELIKQNMNAFFTNENNVREKYFTVDEKKNDKNANTPEITFQDQILIDGQIECAEFELMKSKGFIFIVFDNYSLLDTKTIDYLIKIFLESFIFNIIMNLDELKFKALTKKVLTNLDKKVTWSQSLNNNWNEILIGKQRFQLKEKQKAFLEELDKNFFRRWSYMTVKQLNQYSKLGIHLLKDDDKQWLESDFCDKKKLEIFEPEKEEIGKLGCKLEWIKKKVINNLDDHKKK